MNTPKEDLTKLSDDELQARLSYSADQMQIRAVYAQWWMALATSETNRMRNVMRGDGHYYTAQELEEDAFTTSKRHIELMQDNADARDDIRREILRRGKRIEKYPV